MWSSSHSVDQRFLKPHCELLSKLWCPRKAFIVVGRPELRKTSSVEGAGRSDDSFHNPAGCFFVDAAYFCRFQPTSQWTQWYRRVSRNLNDMWYISSKQLSSFNSYCVYSVYRMAWDLYKSVQFKIKTQKMALWLIFAADYNTDKFVI